MLTIASNIITMHLIINTVELQPYVMLFSFSLLFIMIDLSHVTICILVEMITEWGW